MTHICVGKLTIISSDNGLSPGRRQAIIRTNAGILLIGPLRTNFSGILSEIHTFSFKKMHLKMSFRRWRPFCFGLNVLIPALAWCHQGSNITWTDDEQNLWRHTASLYNEWKITIHIPLQWRHNDHDGVSIHQPHGWLLNRLFRRRSKKTSKLRITGLCEGNSPRTGELPAQRASNAEKVSIWWRHHATMCNESHTSGFSFPTSARNSTLHVTPSTTPCN